MSRRVWSLRAWVLLALLAVGALAYALWGPQTAPPETAETSPQPRAAGKARPLPPPLRSFGRFALPDAHATADESARFGSIAGIVRDWETDAPVEAAELTFLDATGAHSVVSGGDGRFVFDAPAQGSYALASVLATGYHPYAPELGQSAVRFVARPQTRVEGVLIHLVPELEIVGTVVGHDGSPAAGAQVRVLGVGTGETALADAQAEHTADAAGEFRFTAALGTWLEAQHAELGVGRAEVDERALATRKLSIRLAADAGVAEATIGGTVVDPDGEPIEGARVVAGASAFVPSAEAVTDVEGRFTIEELVAGEYRLEASHPDFAPVWTPRLPTGSTDIRLQLAAGGTIEGTILTEDGAAISGATVIVMRHTGGIMRVQQARATVFDANGSYRITGLPPGLYDVSGAAHGRGLHEVTDVDVDAGEVTVDLRLPTGVRITGRVIDETTEAPLVAARVELERHVARGPSITSVLASAMTDAAGEFTLEGIEPGRHSITAYAREHKARALSGIEVAGADVGPLALALAPDDGSDWSFEFAGIGVSIRASPTHLDVLDVVEDGGADRAGVRIDDHIVAVDGIPVPEFDFTGAVEALRGMEGTEVRLSIVRGAERLELTAVRARIRW